MAPSISAIATSPNPAVSGQLFTLTLTGSNFDAGNSTVHFSGLGCGSPCNISASGAARRCPAKRS